MDGQSERPGDVHMLLPHELLHCLATSGTDTVFQSVLLGNLDGRSREAFWKHVKALPPWSTHPVLQRDDFDGRRLIGFTMHFDGAQMFHEDEYLVWSFSSVFAKSGMINDVLMYQFPFAVIPDRHLISKNASQQNLDGYFARLELAIRLEKRPSRRLSM